MAGYRSRVFRRKPYISMTNRLKRIDFAKYYIHKSLEFWRTVIFSDEGKFCPEKPLHSASKVHLVPTVKCGGGGVMVWGCRVSNGVGKLEYIKSIMNKYD
ncbi:transposable element Tc1 transposase [Trichonephila clavipes]|nr:transposable element Tc1 transposase [Trichonephila clavipes]